MSFRHVREPRGLAFKSYNLDGRFGMLKGQIRLQEESISMELGGNNRREHNFNFKFPSTAVQSSSSIFLYSSEQLTHVTHLLMPFLQTLQLQPKLQL